MDIQNLTAKKIKEISGERIYYRGEKYFFDNKVLNLMLIDNKLKAKVRGSALYSVEVSESGQKCSCPYEGFCKHIVAALLAYLNSPKTEEIRTEDIKSYLKAFKKEKLIEIILENSMENERLLRKLKTETALKANKSVDVKEYMRIISSSFDLDFIDYNTIPQFVENIEDIRNEIDGIIDKGFHAESIQILIYFLEKCVENINNIDDNGEFGDVVISIGDSLSKVAKKMTEQDIENLLDLYTEAANYGIEESIEKPMSGLNDKMLLKTKSLVFEKIKSYEGWEKEALASLLLFIVEKLGQEKEYIETCKNFNMTECLVDKLSEKGELEEAIKYAKSGELDMELLELYKKKGDLELALQTAWKLFKHSPWNIEEIRGISEKLNIWEAEREKLIDYLKNGKSPNILASLYLERGDVSRAYSLKSLSEDMKNKIAERVSADKALNIYLSLAEDYIRMMGNENYRTAVAYLEKIKDISPGKWQKIIAAIKEKHAPKRNLMKLLENL